MAYIDSCYNYDGVHYPGEFCPHYEEEDEQGPILPPGWTVQQN